MIEVLQTNSTVTTTIPQQAGVVSFLGASLTDWIMAVTAIAVAAFAYVTVREANKDRRKNSIERQLEKLYNPMLEIMDRAEVSERYRSDTGRTGSYCRLDSTDCARLRQLLTDYGYYLSLTERGKIKTLLSMGLSETDTLELTSSTHFDFPSDHPTARLHGFEPVSYVDCLDFIKEKKEHLRLELEKLT